MNKIRRFTELDWYAFVGAEKFADGSEPFIYEATFTDDLTNLTVVADRNGISININTEDDNIIYFKDSHFESSLQAESEIKTLVTLIESYTEVSELCYDIDNFSKFSEFAIIY